MLTDRYTQKPLPYIHQPTNISRRNEIKSRVLMATSAGIYHDQDYFRELQQKMKMSGMITTIGLQQAFNQMVEKKVLEKEILERRQMREKKTLLDPSLEESNSDVETVEASSPSQRKRINIGKEVSWERDDSDLNCPSFGKMIGDGMSHLSSSLSPKREKSSVRSQSVSNSTMGEDEDEKRDDDDEISDVCIRPPLSLSRRKSVKSPPLNRRMSMHLPKKIAQRGMFRT